MVDQVSLSPGLRDALAFLQRTRNQINEVQENLQTGQKINSALEDPQKFLSAQRLNQEAEALLATKERIGQGITKLKAANNGIDSIRSLLDEGEGLAQDALNNLGSDADSISQRRSLAKDFNEILTQIGGTVADSGVEGTNLLQGQGGNLAVTSTSRDNLIGLAGIAGADVTNIQRAAQFGVQATGAGDIGASSQDIKNAQDARGLENLRVAGLQSKEQGNLAPIEIEVEGGSGEDRTITVSEGEESVTRTFDKTVIDAKTQRFQANFDSGTEVTFDVNGQTLDAAEDGGQGTSKITKTVGLELSVRGDGGATKFRDGTSEIGEGRLYDGENAFPLPDGTVRLDVSSDRLQQAADYPNTLSEPLGKTPETIKQIETASGFSFNTADIGGDTRYNLVVNISNDTFDSDKGTYAELGTKLEYQDSSGATVTAPGGTLNGDDTITFSDADGAGGALQADLDYKALQQLVSSSAATAGEVENTFESISGPLTSGDVSVESDPTGFLKDFVSTLTIDVAGISGPANDADVTIKDGDDGQASKTVTQNSTATFTLTGGANDGAEIALKFNDLTAFNGPGDTAQFSYDVRGEFTSPGSTQVIAREGQQTDTRYLETVQRSGGESDANQATVPLNPDNSNQLRLEPEDLRPNGQGLGIEPAPNFWRSRDDVELSLDQIERARARVDSAATGFSTELNILQGRQDFNEASANIRKDQADRLVGTDLTGEAARLKALQARQQLAVQGLGIAGSNQEAILTILGGGGSATSSVSLTAGLFS